MRQQQPNGAAQIVPSVIKLTGSLNNRRSLLCRNVYGQGCCSIALHVAELGWRQSSLRARFIGGMFNPWQLRAPLMTEVRPRQDEFEVAEIKYDVFDDIPRLKDRCCAHIP